MDKDRQKQSRNKRLRHVDHFDIDDLANPLVSWNCVTCSFPLVKKIKGMAAVDLVRGTIDTLNLFGILIVIITLGYESVQLASSAQIESSDTFKVAHQHYLHNRNTLILILGFGVFIFGSEVPLAILLYKCTKKQSETYCYVWLQASGVLLFLNMFIFVSIMVYAEKAELIRDDLSTAMNQVGFMVYGSIFRFAIYDVCKGAEMIIAFAYSRELKSRKRQASNVLITSSFAT